MLLSPSEWCTNKYRFLEVRGLIQGFTLVFKTKLCCLSTKLPLFFLCQIQMSRYIALWFMVQTSLLQATPTPPSCSHLLLRNMAWSLLWLPCSSNLGLEFWRDGETLGRGESVRAGEFIIQLHPEAKDTPPWGKRTCVFRSLSFGKVQSIL